MTELQVLRTIALKGRASAADVAVSTGLPEAEVEQVAIAAAEAGHLKELPKAFRVTAEGRERLTQLLAEERTTVDTSAMADLYEEFCVLNARAKQVFTSWQVREGAPNDHTDAAYDAEVLEELTGIHEKVRPIVERVGSLAPRAGRYVDRLDAAQKKYAAGDTSFVTRPIIDSYHTVWFELHEDLIHLAGLTRADEAAAGRAH